MTAKIIVCVTTRQASVALFTRGEPVSCVRFRLGEEGQKAFGELLLLHPGIPVYVMVDSVEEDYHSETLPHTSGRVRQELVQRKLKQIYRSTPYRTAWFQERENDKRRDDRYLFAALTNMQPLRPWLEIIHSLQAPLAGVYLLPMVSQSLLTRLNVAQVDMLLVSHQDGGLRQSFFQNGQLRASRLALSDPEAAIDFDHLATEIGKTRLYLSSLRLVPRDARLTVLLADPNDALEPLQARLEEDPSLACHRLSRADLRTRIGKELANCPYALHMTVLAQHPPGHNLAPLETTRSFWHYRERRLLYGVSAGFTVLALAWAGVNLYQQHQLENRIRQLELQTRDEQARYVEVTKTFPESPTSADKLEIAVQLAARLKQDSRTPERAMQTLSRALEANPEIALTRMNWKFDATEGDKGSAPTGAATARESCLVEAEIRPFQGDYRAAMESINRLADTLRHDNEVAAVSVVQMPLNVNSAAALSGNTTDATSAETTRAEFKLRLVLKERT